MSDAQAQKMNGVFIQHVRNAEPWAEIHSEHADMSSMRNLGFSLGKIEGIVAAWCHLGHSYRDLDEGSRISYERMYAIWDEADTLK